MTEKARRNASPRSVWTTPSKNPDANGGSDLSEREHSPRSVMFDPSSPSRGTKKTIGGGFDARVCSESDRQAAESSKTVVRMTRRLTVLAFGSAILAGAISGAMMSSCFVRGGMTDGSAFASRAVSPPADPTMGAIPSAYDENDSSDDSSDDEMDENDSSDEETERVTALHAPGSGHQLFVKIRNVDVEFLNSKERLIAAMRNVISTTQLSILSHHCQSSRPSSPSPLGLKCVALLSEGSHLAFQTWTKCGPDDARTTEACASENGGSMVLDLLSSGSNQFTVLDVVPFIRTEFSIPIAATAGDEYGSHPFYGKPIFRFAQKLRHPREDDERGFMTNPFWHDMGEILDHADEIVEKIVTVQSPFQRLDVIDFVDTKANWPESYFRSLTDDGSYESLHKDHFQPERHIFMDGVIQSVSGPTDNYHEALVQPAMFANSNPKRVAIIGGGEGSTLREVLKHKTLEKVYMIEIDEVMVDMARKYMHPLWNGCDEIVGSTSSCFDDPRAEVKFEDALAWFIDRFYDGELPSAHLDEGDDSDEDSSDDDEDDEDSSDDEEEKMEHDEKETASSPKEYNNSPLKGTVEKLDVIIMDAHDPQDSIEFTDLLYKNDVFLKSLYNALNDDGVLVAQLGEASDGIDPAEEDSDDESRAEIEKLLIGLGFKSLHIYEDIHCGYGWPWTFLMACKSYDCRSRFYANPAQIDRAVHTRILPSTTGSPLLRSFDGATHSFYQMPSKTAEAVYCRKLPIPVECRTDVNGYRPHENFVTEGDLEFAGDGTVAAAVDIPKMSYVRTGEAILVPSGAGRIIEDAIATDRTSILDLEPLIAIVNGFGIDISTMAKDNVYIDSGFPSLLERGTSDKANIDNFGSFLSQRNGSRGENSAVFDPYSPTVARHLPHFSSSYLFSTRDISKGEELVRNFVHR